MDMTVKDGLPSNFTRIHADIETIDKLILGQDSAA